MTEQRHTAVEAFRRTYDTAPDTVWRAPGRVNLIGEHTDYNDGFVLPLALPQGATAAIARRADGRVHAVSTGMSDRADSAVADLAPGTVEGWAGYVLGVVWALRESGHELPGLDVLVDGDVPPGAGLSSSAALECAIAAAVDDLLSLGLDRDALVAVARRAENDFVGVPSGMLDQSASLLCETGHALLLDCRSGERRQVPFDLAAADLVLLVIDTRAPHQLVDGEYARRRQQCEQAARELGVASLRDVDGEGLDERTAGLADVLARRVRHVVTENARVLETVSRLDAGDPRGTGELLTASHASLRDDYEVSCAELDAAVDAAVGAGAHGARMTGGGFGGSAIALVDTGDADTVRDAVVARFAREGMREPHIFAVRPDAGAHRLPG